MEWQYLHRAMKYSLFFIGCITLLSYGCDQEGSVQINQPQLHELSDSAYFSLMSDFAFKRKIVRDDKSIAYINYDDLSYYRDKQDVSIKLHLLPCLPFTAECALVHSISYSYFRTSCRDSVKNPLVVENSRDIYTVTGEFPGYPCSTQNCDTSKYGMDHFKGRYLLCSEKDEKIALIEVDQVTPDPEMAEEIFSTFRWTK
jgi:hypothetical protein